MGWEFAAQWGDDPDESWKWIWRRIADDSGVIVEESGEFDELEACIEDARKNGFDEACGSIS